MNLNAKDMVAKRTLIFFLGMISFLLSACDNKDDNFDEPAQEQYDVVPSDIDDNLYRFGVNTNPYEFFKVKETPVPTGYTPFYISCYLRHGARGNLEVDYGLVSESFKKAHELGVLSEEGERAYRQVEKILVLDNGKDGNLTQLGAQEHRQIANRMYHKYKEMLLNGSRHIRAVSSTSQRCQNSMNAFTTELLSLDAKLDVSMDTGDQYMTYLTSGAPKDVREKVLNIYNDYKSSIKLDTMSFAKRFFSDVVIGRKVVGSIEKFMSETMDLAAISGAYGLDETLINLYSVEDLKHYTHSLSLYIYLSSCNSKEFGDRRMARPQISALVKDFIEKADSAVFYGNCVADLRFGHDSHLLAFCSKIGVKGIGERLTKDEAVNWPGWLFSPFSANFYMVFYRNRGGHILVKCFINERETMLLGVPGGPYYAWEDLKDYLYSNSTITKTRGNIISDISTTPDIVIPRYCNEFK